MAHSAASRFVHAGTTGELTAKVGKDGSVTLRPIPARGTNATVKTRKARTAFTARTSTFDRTKEDSGSEPFRGFFVLFWLMIAVVFVRTGVRHYSEKGSLWGTSFARLISEDGLNLAVADAIMVSATFLCVPFAKVIEFIVSSASRFPADLLIHTGRQTRLAALLADWSSLSACPSNALPGRNSAMDVSQVNLDLLTLWMTMRGG